MSGSAGRDDEFGSGIEGDLRGAADDEAGPFPGPLAGHERHLLSHPVAIVPRGQRPVWLPYAGQAAALGLPLVGLNPDRYVDKVDGFATGRPDTLGAGSNTPSVSRSAHPNRECHHAMSSVCTTADPATTSRSRPASVVLPLELRPSTASTTGRWRAPSPWPGCIRVATATVSDSARHGPASGSSGASCSVMVISKSDARTKIIDSKCLAAPAA